MNRPLFLLSSLLLASIAFAQRHPVVDRPLLPGAARLSNEIPVSEITYEGGAGGERPRIAAGPHQALVVWSNGVVRLDASGTPLDLFPLIGAQWPYGPHDAAWNGTHYTVAVTRETATGIVISLVDVDPDGHVGPGVDIERIAFGSVNVAIAANDGELAVVYSRSLSDGGNSITALIVSHGVVMQRLQLGNSFERMSPAASSLRRPGFSSSGRAITG